MFELGSAMAIGSPSRSRAIISAHTDPCHRRIDSLHGPRISAKEDCFAKHSHMDSKKQTNGCLTEKAEWHISHMYAPIAVQAPCRLFHHPTSHLITKFGALNPSNNRNRCCEIWTQQGFQAALPKNWVQKDFSSIGWQLLGSVLFLI